MPITTKRVPAAERRGRAAAPVVVESDWQSKRGARSARGEETLTALVSAAEMLFCREPYDAVRVADIVEAAGTSHGTFYKYFESKESIFDELVRRLEDRLLGRDAPRLDRDATIRDRIEQANRNYMRVFRQYGNIIVILDYGTPTQASLRATQQQFRTLFVERVQRNISRWQAEGLISPDIDPYYAAWALGGMVSRFAYVTYAVGEPFDEEKAVEQLTILWVNALGLNPPTPKPARTTTKATPAKAAATKAAPTRAAATRGATGGTATGGTANGRTAAVKAAAVQAAATKVARTGKAPSGTGTRSRRPA